MAQEIADMTCTRMMIKTGKGGRRYSGRCGEPAIGRVDILPRCERHWPASTPRPTPVRGRKVCAICLCDPSEHNWEVHRMEATADTSW
jgi:hypothetical protein